MYVMLCYVTWHLVSPTLYIIIIVYRVNLNKLSRNFVGALRATTTNCRVSFIDLYLVFPRNFRIVFLPHTNTVILLGYLWLERRVVSLFAQLITEMIYK